MIKLLTKTAFFTLLLSVTTLISKAQIGYDFAQYDAGVGTTFNQLYGDAETVNTKAGFFINFTHNQTPFVNYVAELQTGTLQGGEKTSLSGRYFKNKYTALVLRGQLQAGEIVDYENSGLMNVLKNLYISAGLGYILNSIKAPDDINRLSNTDPQFITGGLDKSNELYIPARIGYEIKFFNQYNQPSFKIDLAYNFNMDLSDNMDGFTAGKSKDKMVQYSIGLKFALGDIISYRKSIQ
ncbi:hypothetical protein [Mucilaginibacter phyllosphaerae]|uniref:Outer membrane protein beta-barrel domain-containing protein n=1 Tax=Mucilaginibacter phyllosphaerae TaxID=1812349 RepID=A0A4Y8AJS6_9SPHI|nr:hypothetical protein [Mucilaginibacter phyllosphaerae]MBB3967668.1 hypothetical protein [Mucilaginibacter phyllosphaerae]TEW69276.1 hypothetical protein E2R65_03675 [Mucilaginibacter phyllosphaerae]GGH04108.1 hypothetical protein GCM10007352_07110 [Mucilaginibacter phyllosphaerae]